MRRSAPKAHKLFLGRGLIAAPCTPLGYLTKSIGFGIGEARPTVPFCLCNHPCACSGIKAAATRPLPGCEP